jgi:hypothetical protein
MDSNDDDEDDHLEGDDGLKSMEQSDHPMGAIVRSSDTINQPQWKGLLHNWSLQCKRSQMNVNKAM